MRPNTRLVIALLIWLVIAVVTAFELIPLRFWLFYSGAMAFVALMDMFVLSRIQSPIVVRRVSSTMAVGVWSDVKLRVENHSKWLITGELIDHYPIDALSKNEKQSIQIPADNILETSYKVKAVTRGDKQFSETDILLNSPLRLWLSRRRCGGQDKVKIYPNFAELTKFAILATDNNVSQMGIIKRQRRGEGMDFHQLREYREGDSLRQLDWKATSRIKKLISKEYQDERDQQIMFLVDCSQKMRSKDGEMSHFDYALNATLLLSYVGLKQGDAVGLMAFGGQDRWFAPRKSISSVNSILNTVYDLQPTTNSSDYQTAVMKFLKNQRKRSLVVLVSNVGSEDLDDLLPALKLLQKKHLVLLANLREKVLDIVLDKDVSDFESALTYSATCKHMAERKKGFDSIIRQGVLLADVIPEDLPAAVVNKYLEIKGAGIL